MEPTVVIVNPSAGGGRCGKRADEALEVLRHRGLALEVHRTQEAGEATAIAHNWAKAGRRRFLAVGGDGTAHEVLNGLFPWEGTEPPVLGMLPLGTGNSFLRDFGVTDAGRALDAIAKGQVRRCDLIKATHAAGDLYYINLLSIGFSAEAGELTNRRFKRLGPAGYIAAVLVTAARLHYPSFSIRLDGGPADARDCVLLSFSNSKYTGGTMMMAPKADPTDGELDVVRIGRMGKLAFVSAFPSIFKGTHVERREVELARAKRVDLDLDGPVDVMVDGEVLRLELRSLEVVPSAVEVWV
ncbi:MAG: diacylglycerol kinase family lipid kinase [Sandaracinaceae bacterium]|nr:diacylglycerol kinase family lipid kinase [Sandaracinaceae bacterium]